MQDSKESSVQQEEEKVAERQSEATSDQTLSDVEENEEVEESSQPDEAPSPDGALDESDEVKDAGPM